MVFERFIKFRKEKSANDITIHPKIEKRKIILNKIAILEKIEELDRNTKMDELKEKIRELKKIIQFPKEDRIGILNIDANGDSFEIDRDVLLGELNQIEEALTLERAKYYLNRLKKSISEIKTAKINDINLNRWKEYSDVITDSLWVFKERDTSGAHLGWYWGNFIPQIPHQMMLRYTKKGEWVLDAFVGSGTTLIECRRLGRNGIGIELNSDVVEKARELIEKEPNPDNVVSEVFPGDSRTVNLKSILTRYGIKQVQLLIMHPPYYDIIKFSKNNPKDLSNALTVEAFLKMFGEVVDNTFDILEKGRYFVLVIGDKYSQGEWIPLGFKTMEEVLKRGYKLKGIIVKNFEETRAKRNQQELWRYRALVGGFYIFKHEYIMLFKKVKEKL
jgi:hypothetical protein